MFLIMIDISLATEAESLTFAPSNFSRVMVLSAVINRDRAALVILSFTCKLWDLSSGSSPGDESEVKFDL